MSNFPKTRHEMERAGYRRTGPSVCKSCAAAIEWWKTSNNKPLPMNPIATDNELVKSHWETCPNSKEFKGAPSSAPGGRPATGDKPAPRKYSLAHELSMLRDRTDARVVVVITEHGATASWDSRIPGEDLRHDLISAGNFVRAEILKGDKTV